MTVLWMREVGLNRQGEDTIDGKHSYTRTWQFETDNPKTEVKEVLAFPSATPTALPALGATYSANGQTDSQSAVVSRRVRWGETHYHGWVEVEYDGLDSPTTQPWEVDWGFVDMQRPTLVGYDNSNVLNVVIQNSATDPFDPALQIQDPPQTLTITRAITKASYDKDQAYNYRRAVNSDTFLGFTAGKAKVFNYGATLFRLGQKLYWRERVEIHFREPNWDEEVLDQGYRELVGGVKKHILDLSTGMPVTQPAMLDGAGAALGVGGTPTYLSFRTSKRLTFATLALDYTAQAWYIAG